MLGSKYTLVIRNENNRRHKEKEINTDLVYVHFIFCCCCCCGPHRFSTVFIIPCVLRALFCCSSSAWDICMVYINTYVYWQWQRRTIVNRKFFSRLIDSQNRGRGDQTGERDRERKRERNAVCVRWVPFSILSNVHYWAYDDLLDSSHVGHITYSPSMINK